MKRTHLLAVLFALFLAAPLFAVDRGRDTNSNIVDDVIRMQKSGVAEETIIDFVHKGQARFDVTADDMIALHDASVSRNVIKAILDEADARGERRDSRGSGYAYGSPRFAYGGWYGGWPYFYDPYYSSPFYYDPWYYGPRVSIGFGFGFGGYYGRYRGPVFRHRHR